LDKNKNNSIHVKQNIDALVSGSKVLTNENFIFEIFEEKCRKNSLCCGNIVWLLESRVVVDVHTICHCSKV